ncbi:hypothetical protein NKDENANG_00158 [Candidatus Entotheonellaceae bacterium PAL068K]
MKHLKQTKLGQTRSRALHISERMCVGCQGRFAPQDLIRLVCAPDGTVIMDRSGGLPGRGAHVCFNPRCLRQALQSRKLTVAFRRPVPVPPFETIHHEAIMYLYERLGACLSMAQKAGGVVSGYISLHRASVRASIVCMVLAQDIAAVRAEDYRSWCTQLNIPCLTLFTKERLGRLIGRTHRSAVGLTQPRFRDHLCAMIVLLETLRFGDALSQTTSDFPSYLPE